MTEWVSLAAVFVSVMILVLAVMSALTSRRELKRNIESTHQVRVKRRGVSEKDLDRILSDENEVVRHYFDVLRNDHPESLRSRLLRAGFFSKHAAFYFNILRTVFAFAVFVLFWWLVSFFFVSVRPALVIVTAMLFSGVSFILANVFLDKLGKNKEISYRKLFPDFMDLLIVCVDAGLSIDAALDRVAREFLITDPDFGTHLSIISLEMRAGRAMHEALMNFADQVNLDEARSLAILFRQAIELGSSVGKTLRVFSSEMRQMRLVRAEEKANALPIKMLFPLALFLFPVNLVIVLVPIIISILTMFLSLGTPSF